MPSRVLIANRGEIACRIIRTARRMGIETVAVYSDADVSALHVAQADQRVYIGPPSPRESYLDGARLIAAAVRTGCDAVHPGYGFLSENSAFAQACADAGLTFIGPAPTAIAVMGRKAEAKAIAAGAGIATLPGYDGADQDESIFALEAERIGYPVMIKASAGGGGRGMRRVDTADRLLPMLRAARQEAETSFADGTLLLERCITRPRHIEVQVLADGQGNAIHVFERDCSVQRRHQKVVEEAPAPGISTTMRAALTSSAIRLVQAIGYVGVGTVEFILDAGAADPLSAFYFMEMNTRLQVEHPVSEMVAGIDLVEWQFRVADGQRLPAGLVAAAPSGHAVEVRLCAEDPARRYLPSPGRISRFDMPDADDLRVETGVTAGDAVTPYYDSLLAKLIVHAPTRLEALELLARHLGDVRIEGPRTNLALLEAIMRDPEFRSAAVDTSFLERRREDLLAVKETA